MRSEQTILDEDEDSVGDYISGHYRNDSVAKPLHTWCCNMWINPAMINFRAPDDRPELHPPFQVAT
jgi:hypothetical protein